MCLYAIYFSSWWEGGREWPRELSGKVTTRGCTSTGDRGHIEGRGIFQPRQSSYTTENAEQTAARVSHSPSYSGSLTIFPSLSFNSPLISPILQTLTSTLQEVVTGLGSEVSATCQHYSWLNQAHSLIAKCKRSKSIEMSAQNFEVSIYIVESILSILREHIPLL